MLCALIHFSCTVSSQITSFRLGASQIFSEYAFPLVFLMHVLVSVLKLFHPSLRRYPIIAPLLFAFQFDFCHTIRQLQNIDSFKNYVLSCFGVPRFIVLTCCPPPVPNLLLFEFGDFPQLIPQLSRFSLDNWFPS